MHTILPSVLKDVAAEYANDVRITFAEETRPYNFNKYWRLFINGVRTESFIPNDIAYDIDYGMKMYGKPMSGEELHFEVSEVVRNLVANEVDSIQTA